MKQYKVQHIFYQSRLSQKNSMVSHQTWQLLFQHLRPQFIHWYKIVPYFVTLLSRKYQDFIYYFMCDQRITNTAKFRAMLTLLCYNLMFVFAFQYFLNQKIFRKFVQFILWLVLNVNSSQFFKQNQKFFQFDGKTNLVQLLIKAANFI